MLSQVTYFLSQGMEEEAEEAALLLSKTKAISNIIASHLKKLFSMRDILSLQLPMQNKSLIQ